MENWCKRMRLVWTVLAVFILNLLHAQPPQSSSPMERVGDTLTISGKIIAGSYLVNVRTKPTLLNMYDSSPSHRLMIRIDSSDRKNFAIPPEEIYLDKTISVTGRVENYKGSALIRVDKPGMIRFEGQKELAVSPNTVTQGAVPGIVTKTELKPDTTLQAAWLKKVASSPPKQDLKNEYVVEKQIPLYVNPSKTAPILADLEPGIVISILSSSNKWTYVTVKKPDGSGGIYGFIRNKMFKYLK